jgi:hypothetical protein
MDVSVEKLHEMIACQGYVSLNAGPSKPVAQAMQDLALLMGGRALGGRGGRILETLETLDAHEAPSRSLSSYSGRGAQPWHVDGSHLVVPPRYLILGCVSVIGTGAPPTQLMRIKAAGFPFPASRREVFVVRNGRSSFYSTIVNPDRSWVRFDPGCMKACTEQGCSLLKSIESSPVEPCFNLDWVAGDVLIVDNWAVLHRRASATGAGFRTLLRISLKESL